VISVTSIYDNSDIVSDCDFGSGILKSCAAPRMLIYLVLDTPPYFIASLSSASILRSKGVGDRKNKMYNIKKIKAVLYHLTTFL
jgi:hypothetical protein